VITGGKVTAIGGCQGAAIGGGSTKKGQNISIADAAVMVRAIPGVNQYIGCGDVIGSGMDALACVMPGRSNPVAENVTIDASAKVLFNLTGLQDVNLGAVKWIEEPMPMPESFEGFVIMTPETQTVDRVLVNGLGESGADGVRALPFSLTNAATGATGTIAVNGAKVLFAERLLELPCADNALTLKATEYSMINPPTEIANTTAAVYTNDAEVAVGSGIIVTNGTPAYVVYTAVDGYVFADDTTAKTNQLNTTVNPAVIVGNLPDAPVPLVVAEVTHNGVTTEFRTLEAAWEAARQVGTTANPATIRLLRDIKLTNTVETLTAP